MATFISDALNSIDAGILNYAQNVFNSFAGATTTALQAMGLVGLAFVGFNAVASLVPIRASEYIKWGIRYVVILSVATTWSQFAPIFNIITNVPSSVGARLVLEAGPPNLNVAMDEMVTNIWTISDNLRAQAGAFDFSAALIVMLLTLLGAFMAVMAIIVSAIGKIGLAMAVSLAPIFITALMFRATSDLFTTWTRFTLGFAMIPLALAGIMGAVIGVGRGMMMAPGAVSNLGDVAGYLLVTLAAIFMMSQVPTIVNSLAGGIVATASGVREMQNIGNAAKFAKRHGQPRVQQVSSMVGAARAAEGGPRERMQAALEDSRANLAASRENRERYRARAARLGRQVELSETGEARRAGLQQATRERVADRKAAKKVRLQEAEPAPNTARTAKPD